MLSLQRISLAMSPTLSYVNQFPIENIYLNTFPILFLILGLVEFLFFPLTLIRIYEFFSRSESSNEYNLTKLSDNLEVPVEEKNRDFEPSVNAKIDDESLSGDEVEMVMGRLGIFCHPEGVKHQERLDSKELFKLFEENEPNLDEVKGAFDVFDENKDGFIDASELQRVLSGLGLKDRSEMENCRRMISMFDKNEDGRIDFNEFVKVMESSFC